MQPRHLHLHPRLLPHLPAHHRAAQDQIEGKQNIKHTVRVQRPLRFHLRLQGPARPVHGQQARPVLRPGGQHPGRRAVLPRPAHRIRHAVVPPVQALLLPRAQTLPRLQAGELLPAGLLRGFSFSLHRRLPLRFGLGPGELDVRAGFHGQDRQQRGFDIVLRRDGVLSDRPVRVHSAPRGLPRADQPQSGRQPAQDGQKVVVWFISCLF